MKAVLFWWASVAVAVASPLPPLSPAEERASFKFADPELVVDLVAAEPQIDSPVAVCWDAQGRLLVAEMSDYPRGPEKGQVRLLEDRDGDGAFEHSTIFANDLPFPTCVLPWKDGFFVTTAPNILFLKDTDEDGVADQREIIFSGFGEGNQQLRVNGLFYGLDNWIYGANGRSDGEVRRAGMEPVSLRNCDFRFDPRTYKFEAIAGRSQFGTTRDDWGNRFLSWNTIPIRHEVLPERYWESVPPWTGRSSVAELLSPQESNRVYPLTPAPLTFNNESTAHFNALAGLTIFRGDALGESYRGDAFMGESLRNLVHRRKLVPQGPTFQAVRADTEQEREFLASTDPWFHPVNFADGPDGALYVIDFYRRFVEHPDFVHGPERDRQPWREGAGHGRIWRVRNKDHSLDRKPLVTAATDAADLVNALHSLNGWTRDTAQRLLVEQRKSSVVTNLEALARRAALPETRVQALWTAAALGPNIRLLNEVLANDPDGRVRQQALLIGATDSDLHIAPTRSLADSDVRVRFQALLAVDNPAGSLEELVDIARSDAHDPWSRAALLTCFGKNPALVVSLLSAIPSWQEGAAPGALEVLECLGEMWGFKATVAHPPSSGPMISLGGLATLAGMVTGLERRGQPSTTATNILGQEIVSALVERARVLFMGDAGSEREQQLSLRVACSLKAEGAGPRLLQLAGSTNRLAAAAAKGLFRLEDVSYAFALLRGWDRFPASLRQVIQQEAASKPFGRQVLLSAVEQGSVPWTDLDRHVREDLTKETDPVLRERIRALDRPLRGRTEVLARFGGATELSGDAGHGEQMFAERCQLCHRRDDQGQRVGPELNGIRTRPVSALLVDILDPSRQVTPDYTSYLVETEDGESWTGLLVTKNDQSLTLRLAGGEERVVAQSRIKSLQASQKSLMPDGLEEGWSMQDFADLLAFLKR